MKRVEPDKPFIELGNVLKALRRKQSETLDEVSGAVEIDTSLLELYEGGSDRPSEDVLMLLINHFGIGDDKAVDLWELAGYDGPGNDYEEEPIVDDMQNRSVMIMTMLDTRILYSDNVQINANGQGLTLSFLQKAATENNQQVPIARIGMSYDQAHELMHLLNKTLAQAALIKTNRLPSPKPKKTDN